MRKFLLLAAAPSLALLPACTTTRSDHGERVYFPRTHAYEKKLATLQLTEAEAQERLAQWMRATHQPKHWRTLGKAHPTVIVGDCFAFLPKEKADVNLRGYFVNGYTGAVSQRDEGHVDLPFGLEPLAFH